MKQLRKGQLCFLKRDVLCLGSRRDCKALTEVRFSASSYVDPKLCWAYVEGEALPLLFYVQDLLPVPKAVPARPLPLEKGDWMAIFMTTNWLPPAFQDDY